ncbi:MAG: hypothetical protein FWH17_03105 [Oscillospiraceae bacterium]|nr:hypothetical protein [Oscillospiraceae bacterium]
MRRTSTYLISAIIILISFTACGLLNSCEMLTPNAPESEMPMIDTTEKFNLIDTAALPGVIMKTEHDVYPAGIITIKTFWENESTYTVTYGEYYELYKKENEIWLKVEDISAHPYPSIGYELAAESRNEKVYDISARVGSLNPGDYIICVPYSICIDDGDERNTTQFVASDSFSISEHK